MGKPNHLSWAKQVSQLSTWNDPIASHISIMLVYQLSNRLSISLQHVLSFSNLAFCLLSCRGYSPSASWLAMYIAIYRSKYIMYLWSLCHISLVVAPHTPQLFMQYSLSLLIYTYKMIITTTWVSQLSE